MNPKNPARNAKANNTLDIPLTYKEFKKVEARKRSLGLSWSKYIRILVHRDCAATK
jgi:hypothetical protein